jgi:hypothetical protein
MGLSSVEHAISLVHARESETVSALTEIQNIDIAKADNHGGLHCDLRHRGLRWGSHSCWNAIAPIATLWF